MSWSGTSPEFGNLAVLIAYEEGGVARLVVLGDGRSGRYVSSTESIVLLPAQRPLGRPW